jgi:hypothetical protein
MRTVRSSAAAALLVALAVDPGAVVTGSVSCGCRRRQSRSHQLALVRPSFLIINGGEVWRSGPLGLRAWLGVEVRLGMPRRPAA